MIKTKTPKRDRIEIRVDKKNKNLIEKAARLLGENTSSYVLRHSVRAAIHDIKEHETNRNIINLMSNHPLQ